MKVLIINGSPRVDGNTSRLLKEVTNVFEKEDVEFELYQIGSKEIRGCMACGYCASHNECVLKDDINDIVTIMM